VWSFVEPKWGRPEVTQIFGANRLDHLGRHTECTCTSAVREALEAVQQSAKALYPTACEPPGVLTRR